MIDIARVQTIAVTHADGIEDIEVTSEETRALAIMALEGIAFACRIEVMQEVEGDLRDDIASLTRAVAHAEGNFSRAHSEHMRLDKRNMELIEELDQLRASMVPVVESVPK